MLLRGVFGAALMAQGGYCVSGAAMAPAHWFSGLWALAAGGLLLIGFLTPLAAFVVALGAAGVGLSVVPACSPLLFDSRSALVFGLTILVAIAGLGPGAFSVDARVFGRRQIIIPPPASHSPEQT